MMINFSKFTLLFLPCNNLWFLVFYINVWIYCWSYVKQLCKFKINLECIIISIFASYHLHIIPKSITVSDDNILMHVWSSKQQSNRASLVPFSSDNWRSTVFFTEKKPVHWTDRNCSILFRTQHLLTSPMHTSVCVCVCVYTHTQTHTYIKWF
jgi:hypothetical protein